MMSGWTFKNEHNIISNKANINSMRTVALSMQMYVYLFNYCH